MTSNRPYLLRALYEWILDNELTPHVLVDVEHAGVDAPVELAQQGKLVLNIGPAAVQGLELGDDALTFGARFGGRAREVFVPVAAVLAIYARENGQGMMFAADETPGPDDDGPPERKSGPQLKVVK